MNFKIIAICFFISMNVKAQDSICCRHKKITHVMGVQANQLIRQVFNFSNNNPTINNPYLLTYTATHSQSKWGVDAGLGYIYNNLFDNDGNTRRESNINELNARIGIQKYIPLTSRFSSQFSFHIVLDALYNKSNTVNEFNFQKTTINSTNTTLRYGAGPAFNLRYKINPRVFIGTEMNYYFKTGNTKSTVSTFTEFQGQPGNSQTSKIDNNLTSFVFNVPTAIFLQIKL